MPFRIVSITWAVEVESSEIRLSRWSISNLDPVICQVVILVIARNPDVGIENWLATLNLLDVILHFVCLNKSASLTRNVISRLSEAHHWHLNDVDRWKTGAWIVVHYNFSNGLLLDMSVPVIIRAATFVVAHDTTNNGDDAAEADQANDGTNWSTASYSHPATSSSVEARVSLSIVIVGVVSGVVGSSIVWHVVTIAECAIGSNVDG